MKPGASLKKKILVNINEQNLELIRQLLQKKWGWEPSNSEIVDHVFFDFLVDHQVISFDFPDTKIKIDGSNRVVTIDRQQRKKVRTLDEAIKELKK